MSDLILHHYATSPFSEKVRLVLGLKGLAWRSVTVPTILPKPDVIALTGGYRRTPFMQIGADIYCDSALMCRVIERLQPEPTLYPHDAAGLAEIVSQWADTALFWIAVPYTMQPGASAHLLGDVSADAFRADRAAMNPGLRRATLVDARAALQTYLGRLESMLGDGRPFLLGAMPSIADVSTAQSIWFLRLAPPVGDIVLPYRRVDTWFERVAAFGHGVSEAIASGEAIAIAAAAAPTAAVHFSPDAAFEPGTEVGVVPIDYAHDEVVGALVGLDADEVVVARDDDRAGRVHVHFPRIGFQVKARAPRKETT